MDFDIKIIFRRYTYIDMARPPSEVFIDDEVIRLTRDGVFLSNGEEITHERTLAAFHRFLARDEEGYYIQIGRDFKRIEVEDTAYFVRAIRFEGSGAQEKVILTLLGGQEEVLDPLTLRYRDERLSCVLKEGTERAVFLRGPHTELFLRTLDEGNGYFLTIGGKKYRLLTN